MKIIPESEKYAKSTQPDEINNPGNVALFQKPGTKTSKFVGGCRTYSKIREKELVPHINRLGGIIRDRSSHLWYSPSGVGKSLFAMNSAWAMATGSDFLGWTTEGKKYRVLYLDGEMSERQLKSRFADIEIASKSTYNSGNTTPENLVVYNLDFLEGDYFFNLASHKDRVEAQPLFDKFDVIIVDNIASLCFGLKENESQSWSALNHWTVMQKRRGKTIIFVHHSGKNGDYRGSSDLLRPHEVVISLDRPVNYKQSDGARFVVNFEKARDLSGEIVAPFEARLTTNDLGIQQWERVDIEKNTYEIIIQWANSGMSPGEIATELKKNRSGVYRHINKAKSEGRLPEDYATRGRKR